MYLSLHNRFLYPIYDGTAIGTTYAEPATREDFPVILSMIRLHEGDASARIAAYWLERFPDTVVAFRAAGRQLEGVGSQFHAPEWSARAA